MNGRAVPVVPAVCDTLERMRCGRSRRRRRAQRTGWRRLSRRRRRGRPPAARRGGAGTLSQPRSRRNLRRGSRQAGAMSSISSSSSGAASSRPCATRVSSPGRCSCCPWSSARGTARARRAPSGPRRLPCHLHTAVVLADLHAPSATPRCPGPTVVARLRKLHATMMRIAPSYNQGVNAGRAYLAGAPPSSQLSSRSCSSRCRVKCRALMIGGCCLSGAENAPVALEIWEGACAAAVGAQPCPCAPFPCCSLARRRPVIPVHAVDALVTRIEPSRLPASPRRPRTRSGCVRR